jgi:hypothetical protein
MGGVIGGRLSWLLEHWRLRRFRHNSTRSLLRGNAIVIVFKNGKQQSFNLADVARIEFNTTASTALVRGRAAFWAIGP